MLHRRVKREAFNGYVARAQVILGVGREQTHRLPATGFRSRTCGVNQISELALPFNSRCLIMQHLTGEMCSAKCPRVRIIVSGALKEVRKTLHRCSGLSKEQPLLRVGISGFWSKL